MRGIFLVKCNPDQQGMIIMYIRTSHGKIITMHMWFIAWFNILLYTQWNITWCLLFSYLYIHSHGGFIPFIKPLLLIVLKLFKAVEVTVYSYMSFVIYFFSIHYSRYTCVRIFCSGLRTRLFMQTVRYTPQQMGERWWRYFMNTQTLRKREREKERQSNTTQHKTWDNFF